MTESIEQMIKIKRQQRIGWAILNMNYFERLWWALTGKHKYMATKYWENSNTDGIKPQCDATCCHWCGSKVSHADAQKLVEALSLKTYTSPYTGRPGDADIDKMARDALAEFNNKHGRRNDE